MPFWQQNKNISFPRLYRVLNEGEVYHLTPEQQKEIFCLEEQADAVDYFYAIDSHSLEGVSVEDLNKLIEECFKVNKELKKLFLKYTDSWEKAFEGNDSIQKESQEEAIVSNVIFYIKKQLHALVTSDEYKEKINAYKEILE